MEYVKVFKLSCWPKLKFLASKCMAPSASIWSVVVDDVVLLGRLVGWLAGWLVCPLFIDTQTVLVTHSGLWNGKSRKYKLTM